MKHGAIHPNVFVGFEKVKWLFLDLNVLPFSLYYYTVKTDFGLYVASFLPGGISL